MPETLCFLINPLNNPVRYIWVIILIFTEEKTEAQSNDQSHTGFFFNPYPRTCLLFLELGEGRERVTERNIDVRGKYPSVDFCTHPKWGQNLQPRHVPWWGSEPMTFWFMEWCSNQLSHTVQSKVTQFFESRPWGHDLNAGLQIQSKKVHNSVVQPLGDLRIYGRWWAFYMILYSYSGSLIQCVINN